MFSFLSNEDGEAKTNKIEGDKGKTRMSSKPTPYRCTGWDLSLNKLQLRKLSISLTQQPARHLLPITFDG